MRAATEIQAKRAELHGYRMNRNMMIPFNEALELLELALKWTLAEPGSPGEQQWYCPHHQTIHCHICPR